MQRFFLRKRGVVPIVGRDMVKIKKILGKYAT
jgi:hypothetical protein